MAAAALHAGAAEPAPDMNAFMYSTQRLPACIVDVRRIVLGQSCAGIHPLRLPGIFLLAEMQSAPGRRRQWHYDGHETLAATIASASDLDDLIPTIVAYQIEWNKFHRLIRADESLTGTPSSRRATETDSERLPSGIVVEAIGAALGLKTADWGTACNRSGATGLWKNLDKIARERKRYTLRMLGGTYVGYNRASRQWWWPVGQQLLQSHALEERPIYFVSSNTHSFVNVMSGVATQRQDELKGFIQRDRSPGVAARNAEELEEIEPVIVGKPALLRRPALLQRGQAWSRIAKSGAGRKRELWACLG